MKYVRSLLVVVLGLFVSGLKIKKLQNDESDYVEKEEEVDSPADLTKKGWKAALLRTKTALKDKDLGMAAAALGYYTTLTFFPVTLGLASLYTAVAGSTSLIHLLNQLELIVPPAIQDLLQTQLMPLTHASSKSLGIATLVSLLAVLWTTSGGFQNLVKATNIAYGVEETRNFIKLRLTSILLSLACIVFGAIILTLLILQKDALHALGAPAVVANLFPILRWPLLVIVISAVLALIYRYAPNRKQPRWSWVSWGATAATIIWLAGTVLFFYYVQHFGNFNKSYGTFAGIIILMTWFNLSSFIILLGAQVNNKLEEVTSADTTVDD
jgi:membrane protein